MTTPDYGYHNESMCHVSAYILDGLFSMLGSANNPILDVGCGNGWLGKVMLDRGFDYYGIDASAKGIEIASKIDPNRFFVHDVNNQELDKKIALIKFKTVISTEVIEHIYDPDSFIKFCRSILPQNGSGELIITTPYHGYLKNLALSITGKMDDHFSPLWHGGHIKFFSKKTLSTLLQNNGFEIVRFQGCGRVPYLWKSMLIKARI